MSERVGALWKKKSAKGTYFSGQISLGIHGSVPVVIFKNAHKKGNEPDYHILLAGSNKKEEEDPFKDVDRNKLKGSIDYNEDPPY